MEKLKNLKINVVAGVVIVVMALLGAVLFEWLRSPEITSYETDGRRLSLYNGGYLTSMNSYQQTGNRFEVDGDNPVVRFSGFYFDTESILISFSKPLEEDTALEIFYWHSDGGFGFYPSTQRTIPGGSQQFYIDTKSFESLHAIRFDIDSSFELDDIFLYDQDMREIVQKLPLDTFRVITVFLILFFSALIIYFFCRTKVKSFKKIDVKKSLRALVPGYILMFVSCFMLLIFEPLLMYAMNKEDFWFDFEIMIGPLIGVFAVFFFVGLFIITAIYLINSICSDKPRAYWTVLLSGFILFLLLYIQGNYLNGSLPILEGAEIDWSSIGKIETIVFFLLIVVFVVLAVICVKKLNLERTVKYATIGISAIFLMLSVSLGVTIFDKNALKSKDTFVAAWDNFDTASSQKNFFIFLADTVDSLPFYEAMNNNEEFNGLFDDFTYYSDTLSTYPYTYFSVPQILSGGTYKYDGDYSEFCTNAYNNSPLFEKLKEQQYKINIYSDITWSGNRKYEVENATSVNDVGVNFISYMKSELKYVLFRYLPYPLKPYSKIETMDFNACRYISDQSNVWGFSNLSCYWRIIETPKMEITDENLFQFCCIEGGHLPFNVDKDLNPISGGTYTQKLEATLTIIKAYIDRLKENNIYDNSVIIIISDHGFQTVEEGEYRLQRFNPILFIKGVNEKHEMIKSEIPVSFTDLQAAFSDLLDGKQSDQLFSDVKSPRLRTALLYSSSGWMHEYQTMGTAREWDQFISTGNEYLEDG